MRPARSTPIRRESLIVRYGAGVGDAIRRDRSIVALRASNAKAELARRARSEFLANMNHELRTPLNGVIGFAAMLRDVPGLGEDQRRQYAEFIIQSANGLLDLLNEILDFSALESGKYLPAPEVVDAKLLARSVFEDLAMNDPRAELRLCDDEALAAADPSAASKIVRHLLENALAYAGDEARVRLCVERAQDGVAVIVEDDGCGMDEEALRRALHPFSQVESGHSRPHEGAGLGLTLSHLFAEAMGGGLEALSAAGVGTRMTLTLPFPDEDAGETLEEAGHGRERKAG